MKLAALIAFTTVLLVGLDFTLGALMDLVVVLITGVVHGVGFVLGQLHFAIPLFKGGALRESHPPIHMRLNPAIELRAECTMIMVKGDKHALP